MYTLPLHLTVCRDQATMLTSTAQPVNIICAEGDLLLRTTRKGNENLLLVCSQVMINASGNFSGLLRSRRRPMTQPFAFTSPLNELRLSEDDGDAMLMICNILHGHDQDVPAVISLDTLKSIASSCNRHQLTGALSAWSTRWVNQALSNAVEDEVYTVVAIALDLGVSTFPTMHDERQSHAPSLRGMDDRSLAGVTWPLYTFSVSLTKLTYISRWLSLPTDADDAESCSRTSELLLGHVLCFAEVQRRPFHTLADRT